MKTKILLVVIIYFFSNISYSQSESEIQKSISIIEDLYYFEMYLGEKVYEKLNITLDKTIGKITFNKFRYSGLERTFEITYDFYLDDIDKSIMVVHLLHLGDLDEKFKNSYSVNIEIRTKNTSIKKVSIENDKKKFPYPIQKNEYLDKMIILNGNNPPKNICKKFVDNFIILFNIKIVKYMVYDKTIDDYKEATNPF